MFRPCFTAPVWNRILVLVAGAVLAPGKRTVTQALRVMGLADQPGFGRKAIAGAPEHRLRHLGAAHGEQRIDEAGAGGRRVREALEE